MAACDISFVMNREHLLEILDALILRIRNFLEGSSCWHQQGAAVCASSSS